MSSQIESIHVLSSMQQGLLFHTILEPGTSFYVDQVVQTFDGDLDLDALGLSWQRATERHAVLRTSFHWEGLDEAVQVVHPRVDARVERHDWRETAAGEDIQARVEDFLLADRGRAFALDHAPLFRLNLLRVAQRRHVFVLRYHHILLDAWSALMLLEEVQSGYDMQVRGEPPVFSEAPPYHRYVDWVRGQDMDRAEKFWRGELAGIAEPTALRVSGTGAGAVGQQNPEVALVIDQATAKSIERSAREYRLTLGTVLHTAWGLLLSRYSGQNEVVFGATMTHRPAELDGIEETVGLFINTLPLRVDLPPDAPFAEVCAGVRQRQMGLRAFAASPLASVQGWSEVPVETGLFDTIMTVLNVPRIGGLAQRSGELEVHSGMYRYHTSYPLSLLAVPGQELTLRIGYDGVRFEAAAIERMLGHLGQILRAVAADIRIPVREISLLTPTEQRRLDTWNATGEAPEPELCAHHLFERQVAKSPDLSALSFGAATLTYRQLDQRAEQMARLLRAHGVGPESRVGLCVERSVDQVVAMLGVLKAGGAFVPLDPTYPDDRLAFMSQDAQLSLLVTTESVRRRLPELSVPSIALDETHLDGAESGVGPVRGGAQPDNLAYIIYTSGSTGRPKGAGITHAGLVNSCVAQTAFGVVPDDRVLQWGSASFDASVFEVFLALGAGARLCLATQEEVIPGPGMVELLVRERISILTIPPSGLAALGPEAPAALPGLRTLVLAGETLPATLRDRWAPGRRIFNVYGHTETSIWASVEECRADGEPPSVGSPVRGVRLHLLDQCEQPVPVGVAGELYLGGAQVGRGYLNRPGLTAEHFVPDPFSGLPGVRLYRSGDLLTRRADGRLDFLRRVDRQTKIRGLRIEVGEVESSLAAHPLVRDAVVQVRDAGGDAGVVNRTLVAYLLLRGRREHQVDWREFLGATLPANMVPNSFVVLDAFPLTSNGKLDLAALPAPDSLTDDATDRRPCGVLEERVAQLWLQALGLARIGRHDDFFAAGGNSITATRIVARMREEWQVELSVRSVLEGRTVERCAAALSEALVET